MALTFVLSSFPLATPHLDSFPLRDKGLHFLEYAILGGLCAHAALRTFPHHSRVRAVLLGAFLAASWGLTDELHQSFVPERTSDLYDLVADALGATVGAFVCYVRRAR